MSSTLKEQLDEHLKKIDFSGVVSIYRGEEPYYEGAFGYRDKPNAVANNAKTLFGIASGTKTFTAAGVLTLLEEGKLTLSTPVGEIIGANASYIHRDATIKQLLNHSSGIFDYYDEEVVTDFDNFKVDIPWCELGTPSDYLPLFEGKKMKFSPGTRVSYSNGGYVFLGVIIERITGMKYREYMKKHVFGPLGMASTGFYAFDDLPGNTAWGYMKAGESWMSNIYKLPIRGGGDGGLYTNTDDRQTDLPLTGMIQVGGHKYAHKGNQKRKS